MLLRPPCSTRTDTLFSYTTRFRAAAERRLRGHRRVLVGNLPALPDEKVGDRLPQPQIGDEVGAVGPDRQVAALQLVRSLGSCFHRRQPTLDRELRSEEHTSELQSLMRISSAVFCLKKKSS